ncbi:amino acid permease-domain-containing protein [Annulohypoxylon maeteangense]|uniref:amino acid permease-domain-containing protein n=1 Tax=Annulohypoxylon maeteangense TaxID=1927788 RepID=UPI002007A983|nr:amino acid permease-domain-containing protein [Annulohypoxylon maeteangense]KAI0884455.1 amino acid permease-domain-containing protein [Annulohypoxylon maeteangense]
MPPESRGDKMDGGPAPPSKKVKLSLVAGVFVPVVLNIISILMFLRFGSIMGRIGLLGMLGLLVVAYIVDFITTLSLSAIASNGEVKGGGAYYLISRSLGPEFGGSIGILFYLAQVVNTSLNIVGLIDCLKLNLGSLVPHGYWESYAMQTAALVVCTGLSLAGRALFVQASGVLLVILIVAIISIPISTIARSPFKDDTLGIEFTGFSLDTMRSNLYPHAAGPTYRGLETFRQLFGILFSATSGIFAGASMSGDLRNPSKAIPKGTLWAMAATFVLYLIVILSIASSITHPSFLRDTNIISTTSIWSPLILAGECATTFFSALMGIVGGAKLLQALGRDKLLPGLFVFGKGNKRDDPILAVLVTYIIAQVALFADLNQIATFISMGYQMTFFVMNLACFLLKIGSAPNFRPAFKFFSWHTAFVGSVLSAAAMFFIDGTYAASAICVLIFLFLIIHYTSPPKHWGDVSQNLIYHQVRKYLLRLKPEHIKFWRPQIILLINDPRHHTRLIQFCNSLKKGSLYILGHVIVTDDFNSGVHEAKLQQSAWTRYISEFSRIKAFVQLTMSPTIEWGARNLIISAGLGGMRPNIAILGFYNMDELRKSRPLAQIPEVPSTPTKTKFETKAEGKVTKRRRGDTSARLLDGFLPTDTIRTESMMSVTSYLTILEDLALRHRLNVAVGKGFQALETPRRDGNNTKKYIDLWPIQMSAEITDGDQKVWTTNFDTYTLILQLGYILQSVPAWKKAYQLRILVFVEYESEVKQEEARLKALLDKLRIDATIRVFWLASGQLQSYETIVNGRGISSELGNIVNELLKDDEWWQELQKLRTESHNMSRSQELASLGDMLNATRRRGSSVSKSDAHGSLPRGLDVSEFLDGSKKPTVSTFAKLGVNFGIHTHQLNSSTFGGRTENNSPDFSDDDGESIASEDVDFNDIASAASDGGEGLHSTRRSNFLTFQGRRRSHGDLMSSFKNPENSHTQQSGYSTGTSSLGYGTMVQTAGLATTQTPPIQTSRSSTGLLSATSELSEISPMIPKPPPRPALSRHSSATRFTSKPTPETTVLTEGETGSRITFSKEEEPSRAKRPPLSRNASTGRFSSRPVPETRVEDEDGTGPRLTFAEPEPSSSETPLRSRRNSASKKEKPSEIQFNLPELLASYHPGRQSDDEAHSTYSTQSLPLSFNDLPSRAQHLILNELMRQHSSDTAVLLTTLPIPEEGTCQSEEASLGYLTDIEVLCHELPPVLLVLSNNMTVTVNL